MVDSIRLFDLAGQQAHWLALRQTTIAGNIANANTPGYQTQDVKPFSELVSSNPTTITMRATNPRHIVAFADNGIQESLLNEDTSETTHSGNNVSLEDELRKGSEVSRNMSLNTAIVKSFQRMLLAAVKV